MTPDFFGDDADIAALERQRAAADSSARPALLAALAWYLRQRDTRRACDLADEAEALLHAAPEPSQQAVFRRLALVRAETKLLFGDPAAAVSLAAASHADAEAAGDWACATDALLLQAGAGHHAAGSREALMREAQRAAQRSGDETRRAATLAWEACDDVLVDHRAAMLTWSTMIDEFVTHPHPGVRSAAVTFRAHHDALDERPAAAAAGYAQVFDLHLASGQLRSAINAASNLVAVHNNLGDYTSALEWCQSSIEIARGSGWPVPAADALTSLGRCQFYLGQYEKAHDLFAEAAATLSAYPGLGHWITTTRYAGENLLAMGRYEEAFRWLRRSVVASRKGRRLEVAASCRFAQATALSRLGWPKLAMRAIEQAMAFNERSGGRRSTLAHILHACAGVAREHALPPPPGSRFATGAIHHLEAALAEIESYAGFAPDEWLSELSRDYERLGDLARALACERRAAQARVRTQSRKAADLAASLQVRHETERVRAEAAHHKALAEAQAARADAEARANRAKTTFLANMSHELRSPLNAMLGFTRLLLRDTEMARQREELGIVLRSGEHLYTLINQVLEMSKIEAGRVSVTPVDFDLLALLDELREMFSVSVRAKKLRLQVHAAAGVPQHVRADAMKLRQVLINLLSNAVKFTEAGGVELEVSALTGGEGLVLSFCVADTGVGIEADDLAQLGGAFQQAQAGRQAAEGTGLGLAISGGFVQLMGGELRLSSTPGVGTRASFDIPVQPVEGPAVEVRARHRRVVGLAAGTPATRILVVDDRADGRMLLARTLQPLGFQVREAADGLQAVNACAQWSPHLVLMDMRMPVMDGREATRRIRAADPGVVVIALTASSFEEQREDILAAGCHDFMRKPLDEDALLDAIARHLHLQLRYGDESLPPLGTQPDAGRLAAVPAPLREQLRTALARLDVAAVEEAMHELQRHDTALAAAVQPLIRRFDYGRVNAMLGGPR